VLPTIGQSSALDIGPLLLCGVAVAWYVGVRALIDALSPSRFATLTHALAMSMPASLLSAWAVAIGRADVAVAMVFSSAVSAMSLALGAALLSAPRHVEPSTGQRWWLMLGPLSGVALLAGLSGRVGGLHIVSLLTIAVLARLLVRADVPQTPVQSSLPRDPLLVRVAQALLAVLLVATGCHIAFVSIELVNVRVGRETGDILATILFGPASALPLIGAATHLLRQHRSTEAVGSLVGSTVLLLGVTLPTLALAWSLLNFNPPDPDGGWFHLARSGLSAIAFPLRVWRVDAVLLVVLSIAIAPSAFGRWSLGRIEGLLLVLLYLGYLVASVATTA
jgi:Ca2+/Na+ antiporter